MPHAPQTTFRPSQVEFTSCRDLQMEETLEIHWPELFLSRDRKLGPCRVASTRAAQMTPSSTRTRAKICHLGFLLLEGLSQHRLRSLWSLKTAPDAISGCQAKQPPSSEVGLQASRTLTRGPQIQRVTSCMLVLRS